MANSGIYWIDVTFNWCVTLLYEIANFIGITYEEINVWLFVVIVPIAFILSLTLNMFFIISSYRDKALKVRIIE
jgi:hypothetical protein